MAIKCTVCYDKPGGCYYCNPALNFKQITLRAKRAIEKAAADVAATTAKKIKAVVTGNEKCGYRGCKELQSRGCGMQDCPFGRNFQSRKRSGG